MYNVVVVHRTEKYFVYDDEIICTTSNIEQAEKVRAEHSSQYTLKDFRENILGVFVRPVKAVKS